jgi:hypothetical protein
VRERLVAIATGNAPALDVQVAGEEDALAASEELATAANEADA